MLLSEDDDDTLSADFPEPVWAKFTLLGLVFVGAMLGMLTMVCAISHSLSLCSSYVFGLVQGYLGDAIGNKKAMLVTVYLTITGALVSSLLSWGSMDAVYGVICAGRLMIGERDRGRGAEGEGKRARCAERDLHSEKCSNAVFAEVFGRRPRLYATISLSQRECVLPEQFLVCVCSRNRCWWDVSSLW